MLYSTYRYYYYDDIPYIRKTFEYSTPNYSSSIIYTPSGPFKVTNSKNE